MTNGKLLDIIRTAAADCTAQGNTMAANELLEAVGMVRELLAAMQPLVTSYAPDKHAPSVSAYMGHGTDREIKASWLQARAAIAKATGATS